MPLLSRKFADAVAYAADAHAPQTRKAAKGSSDPDIPYISHLLAVAGLVIEDGGNEDEAIAGLLHDVIEDQDKPEGSRAPDVERCFGDTVLRLVEACSGPKKEDPGMGDFRVRKQVYLDRLNDEQDAGAVRVSLADKVHNARSTVNNLEDLGVATWDRFNSGRTEQLWWYGELARIYSSKVEQGLASTARAAELRRLVTSMGAISG